ncbi:Dixin [Clydaea vesicula]|uniref:Dixin n=1 Tax=Clydaea vesicula TaxID=447962 RepID=A0AAD5XYW6_9FUNG|nr:Dixin [Clydaea vesicula]
MTFFRLGWMFGNSTELLKRIFWLNFKKAIGYVKTLPPLREGTANTSIEFHEGRILALQEVSLPFHIVEKEGDFKSIGYLDYNEKLKHGFTAHPKICPISGEMRFFGYDSFKDPHFNYSVVKNDEIITNFSIEKEQLPYPTMMHDFGITQNYSIVIDFPLIFDLNLAKQGKFPVTFKSDFPSRFGVFPKHASDSSNITWFTVKTCYMFHLLNCWEDTNVDGDLIINIVGCRSPGFNFKYNAEVVNENKNKFKPYIWKLNFSKKIVVSENEIVTSLGEEKTMDFPKCHPKLQGLPVKYGYFSILLATNDIIGSVKINLKTMKEEKVLIFGEGKSGGETWFEPKKLAKSEDDGYLLTFVHDMKNVEANESELWIWDALTMNETPLAKIKIPSRIPYGFHCKFISKEQLLQQK